MIVLPICCVTGRIAGDGFACGDCDPCGAAHAVPEVVKALMKERDEWADKYECAAMCLDEERPAIDALREWHGMQSGQNTNSLYNAASALFNTHFDPTEYDNVE